MSRNTFLTKPISETLLFGVDKKLNFSCNLLAVRGLMWIYRILSAVYTCRSTALGTLSRHCHGSTATWNNLLLNLIINPLTADSAYIRVCIFYQHIKYHINMLKIKCDINQQDLERVDRHFVNLNNFHSLEVVDRVSETQLQVGENSNWIIWR